MGYIIAQGKSFLIVVKVPQLSSFEPVLFLANLRALEEPSDCHYYAM